MKGYPVERLAFVVVVLIACLAAGAPRGAEGPEPLHEKNVAVPMRDGVQLRADILRPAGSGPSPTLVYRTPYGKDAALKEYTTFRRAVERGYAVVVQDVRGRYASDGNFRPYEQEGRDGYDTIEWAAQQPWSNGRVGTFGLSYPGAVQWLAAMETPPHLEAMVPAMTFSTPQNFFFAWGIPDLSWIAWIWHNIAPDARARMHLDGPKTRAEVAAGWASFNDKMLRTLPLNALAELRDVAPYYYDWLRHPPEDPYWNFAELRDKYGRTQAAVLNLSGWHDDNYGPEGAITNFSGLVRARGGEPLRTSLLLGPWVHGVSSTARTRSGELDFGPAAAIDYDEVVLGWMDRYVKGDGKGPAADPVRYFVMGANRWKTSSAWPPSGHETVFYLSQAPSASGALSSTPPTGENSSSHFRSDPENPVINPYETAGAHDYQKLAERGDVLTFDTAPLASDLEVAGPIRARMYVSCDCRDTDLWVRILDVGADGRAHNVMSPGLDAVRVSYRDLSRGRQLLEPGTIYEIQLDHLVTANRFLRGHRLRLQVSSAFFPNFSRNLHSGELETTSSRMQPATITVHHDRKHPSQIGLHVTDP
jgi:putative CocE/NonD family hydrolase